MQRRVDLTSYDGRTCFYHICPGICAIFLCYDVCNTFILVILCVDVLSQYYWPLAFDLISMMSSLVQSCPQAIACIVHTVHCVMMCP